MFKMKTNKSIVEMFTRFTDIVNVLEGFGSKVSEMEIMDKILRSQPFNWDSKTNESYDCLK